MKKTLIAFVALLVAPTLHAEYNPDVNMDNYPQVVVKEGANALKAMPVVMQEAIIAEALYLMVRDVEKRSSGKSSGKKTRPPHRYYDGYYNDRNGVSDYYYHRNNSTNSRRSSDNYNNRDTSSWVVPKFVSSGGILISFDEAMTVRRDARTSQMIDNNHRVYRRAMAEVGVTPIFSMHANAVTRVVKRTAKYHLKSLNPKLRDLALSYLAGIFFTPQGSNAMIEDVSANDRGTRSYSRRSYSSTDPQMKEGPASWDDYEISGRILEGNAHREYSRTRYYDEHSWQRREQDYVLGANQVKWQIDAEYIDSQGNRQSVHRALSNVTKLNKVKESLRVIIVCASYIGAKDILDLYPKEVKAMRKASKKTMEELAKNASSQNDTKTEAKDDTKTDTKSDSKDDAKDDTKSDSKDEAKDDTKDDTKTDSKDDAKDDAKDDTKSDSNDDDGDDEGDEDDEEEDEEE